MNKEIIEVLKKIYNELNKLEILWILSGSVSLAIQGVQLEPNDDIDILTDEAGSNKIYFLLKEYCVKKPKYSNTEKYRSHFSIYKIGKIKVEVMGDFQYKLKNNDWSEKNHLHEIHEIYYEDMKLKVLEVKQELEEYKNLDRLEKVQKIEEFINSKH